MPTKIQKLFRFTLIGATLLATLVFSMRTNLVVEAATFSQLQSQAQTLSAQIKANNAKLAQLEDEADTLKNKLASVQIEIDSATTGIELTRVRIADLQEQLEKAQAELDRQKELLKTSLRALYKNGNASSFELLVGSQSFSQFINQQEYLTRLKTGIQASTEKVIALKQQITEQQNEQKDLLVQQESQRKLLDDKKAEQQNLLVATQGQESAYRALTSDLRKQYQETQTQLLAFLSNTNFTPIGPVLRGEVVGRLGSSGLSTGPHVHFAVEQNGSFLNPISGGGLVNGLGWPLPYSDMNDITQAYGCTDNGYEPYNGGCPGGHFHQGVDIGGSFGDPVVAAGDGVIIYRGWYGCYGETVIIDHGDGLRTFYPHLNSYSIPPHC